MQHRQITRSFLKSTAVIALCLGGMSLTACGGGSSASPASAGTPPPPPQLPPPPPPPPTSVFFATEMSTAQFLTRATFGPTAAEIDEWSGQDASDWFKEELTKPVSLTMPIIQEYQADLNEININEINTATPSFAFWRNAIEGDDQLRQRMAFALSHIFVISSNASDQLRNFPEGIGLHADILANNAFGNYRELLEEITYSPGMGHFLTYMGNQKGDPSTGRVPDENYARELLQLFTIGVVELNQDGTEKRGEDGQPIEIYDNSDITGLARVFTGLIAGNDGREFRRDGYLGPMEINENRHSDLEKSFLGSTIPADTDVATSIDMALDTIMAHENVAPFVSRQLIQRLVTSHPDPSYVERVANVFDAGQYNLPDGTVIGDGRKGDLSATVAAILFDSSIEGERDFSASFGKIREPLLRFSHWARSFEVSNVTPETQFQLIYSGNPDLLGQQPHGAPSVFNFFRPGYVAPGTETGEQGLTVPELQITNASSITNYANFMAYYIFEFNRSAQAEDLENFYEDAGYNGDASAVTTSFLPDYSDEISLADNADALLDHLGDVLTNGQLSPETKASIITILETLPYIEGDNERADQRVRLAIFAVMTSGDYLVQR